MWSIILHSQIIVPWPMKISTAKVAVKVLRGLYQMFLNCWYSNLKMSTLKYSHLFCVHTWIVMCECNNKHACTFLWDMELPAALWCVYILKQAQAYLCVMCELVLTIIYLFGIQQDSSNHTYKLIQSFCNNQTFQQDIMFLEHLWIHFYKKMYQEYQWRKHLILIYLLK